MRDHTQHWVRSDGSWLRRHAIAEDMGRALRAVRGDSSPMSFAPRTSTTSTLKRAAKDKTMNKRRPISLKSKIESPSAGGRSNLDELSRPRTGASLTRRFFFCALEILGVQTDQRNQKPLFFKGPRRR